ncbi:MAG: VWA domain-containing protein [Pseudobdellovibrionaceae bacterium]
MSWQSPWAFFLIFVLFAVAILSWWLGKNKKPSMQVSTLIVLKKIQPGLRARFGFLPAALKVLGLLLAIFALARPQDANEQVRKNVEGIDIMITIDVSDSMLIEDMPPDLNRMESAKAKIQEFIKGRLSDRIGLIIFSGESFTRVPLTLDYPLLLQAVEEIGPSRTIKMGTALGVSLANAVARLKDSKAKSRVVVFLTDGENNSGTIDPETALDIAKQEGVKIYSIGLGRDGDTRIPVYTTDPFGNQVKRYQPFFSAVNEDLLQRMATETGGKFYRASSGKQMSEVFNDIDRLEKTKVDVTKFTRYTELFPPYAKAAMMIYALGLLLGATLLRKGP